MQQESIDDHHFLPLDAHWYLHHHAVFHKQKPGKTQVASDCSASYQLLQLSDKFQRRRDLTISKESSIAFMSDVEAMFHQVHVRPTDCDALRFLWWPDRNLALSPEEYEITVHLIY